MDTVPSLLVLWSAPRARSTAFFRAMVERGDLTGLHEPFCDVVDHGVTDVAGTAVRDHRSLIAAVRGLAAAGPTFVKDVTDHRYPDVLADRDFLATGRHAFLIRRPAEIAASYAALRPDMGPADVGIEHLHELYRAVVDAGGDPVVVDSDDLVADPEGTLAAYCAAVGLPFRREALRWSPGSRPEWSSTERWHTAVSESSGITRTASSYARTVDTDPELARFCAHHEPFYQALYAERLVPGAVPA